MRPKKTKDSKSPPDRLTITLAAGQREELEAIATGNHTTLAFVVRYALKECIERHSGGQLPLHFPGLSK